MRDNTRAELHRFADWVDRRLKVAYFGGLVDGGSERVAKEWRAMDVPTRRGIVARALMLGGAIVGGAKVLISVETFIAVLLAFSGGDLTLRADGGHPGMLSVLLSTGVGLVVSIVISLLILRPQMAWFISGTAADDERRRQVQVIPMRVVQADLCGWLAAYVTYVIVAGATPVFLLAMLVAFFFAAITSACLNYMFIESAVRPLVVLALGGRAMQYAMHGVRERMLVIWVVSSAVPMVGMLSIIGGRALDYVPEVGDGKFDWSIAFLAFIALASGGRVVGLVGRAFRDPLNEMSEVVKAARDGDLSRRVAVYDASEIGLLQDGVNGMLDGLEERDRMREIFSRHVGVGVADLALEHGGELVGSNADVAVLFVDITGSTSFAARRDPRETAVVLNAFFSIVAEVVEEHGGFINKFEGDAALMVFGAPAPLENAARSALSAARALGEALGEKLPLEWGMGVSCGQVFAGNIGARTRYEYTVIGDPVNESARLSDRAKEGYSPVYASGEAVRRAGDEEAARWRRVDRVTLRGRPEPTEIFAPRELLIRAEPPSLGSVLSDLVNFARPRERSPRTTSKEH